MKIIIATGIFPPDIGGPAHYVEKLALELKKRGIDIEVITYSDSRSKGGSQPDNFPVMKISRSHILPLRYFLYFWQLFLLVKKSKIIYAHDLFSCGLPASLVKIVRRKKLVIRLGGDFLWEKAVENNWTGKPLKGYYQQLKNIQERVFFWIAEKVLKRADLIIFSTNWQRQLYLENYQIKENKTEIIENPFPQIAMLVEKINNQKIIFAGRLIKLKNIDFLITVFSQILNDQSNLQLEIIGQGPERKNLERLINQLNLEKKIILKGRMPYQRLIEEINQCFLVIIPSLTEISPNLVLECIQLKKPILLTKETGFYERFKDKLIFIDPFDKKDLENKIRYLLQKENYQSYIDKLSTIPTDYSWPAIVEQHLDIFKNLEPK